MASSASTTETETWHASETAVSAHRMASGHILGLIRCFLSVSVIDFTLFAVGQYSIGFADFLEVLCRLFISWVFIGMPLSFADDGWKNQEEMDTNAC